LRDSWLHYDGKAIIYRGVLHMVRPDDINNEPRFGKSVTVWHLLDASNIDYPIMQFLNGRNVRKKISRRVESISDNTVKKQLEYYLRFIAPQDSEEIDLPDYLLISNNGGQLYDTKIFLKKHRLFLDGKYYQDCYYDFLISQKALPKRHLR